MYGIFTYIWVIYGVNVGKYTIHGSSGQWLPMLVGGDWNMTFIFPYIGNNKNPTDVHIFSEGFKPPTRMGMTGSWWSMVIDGY